MEYGKVTYVLKVRYKFEESLDLGKTFSTCRATREFYLDELPKTEKDFIELARTATGFEDDDPKLAEQHYTTFTYRNIKIIGYKVEAHYEEVKLEEPIVIK